MNKETLFEQLSEDSRSIYNEEELKEIGTLEDNLRVEAVLSARLGRRDIVIKKQEIKIRRLTTELNRIRELHDKLSDQIQFITQEGK